jgi:hypothetical protein
MRTRITELFGIKHPIIQGGMHRVGYEDRTARRNRLCACRNRFDDPAAVHDDPPRRALGKDRARIAYS